MPAIARDSARVLEVVSRGEGNQSDPQAAVSAPVNLVQIVTINIVTKKELMCNTSNVSANNNYMIGL